MKKFFYIILFSLFFLSCQKTIDCFSNAGKVTTHEYNLTEFDTLIINNDFEVHLIQDTVNKLIVTAHKKYAETVRYNVENRCLILNNTFNCKFSKPKKNNILTEIHVKEISLLIINYPSKIVSDNTLINDNEIGVIVKPKFFEADLTVNCRVFYFWNTHLNSGKMYLHGNSEYLKLWNTSLFSVDASGLNSDKTYIENNSKGDIYLNAGKFLNCKITSSGNVYYKGNPATLIVEDTLSSGKLIKLE